MSDIKNWRRLTPLFWRTKIGSDNFEKARRYALQNGLVNGREILFAKFVSRAGYNQFRARQNPASNKLQTL